MPTHTSVTLDWAQQLRGLDPCAEPAVIEAARTGLIDYLACALGGAPDPGIDILIDALQPASGNATVIGRGLAVDACNAALLNGYSGHVLDFDDVQRSVRGHPSTVLLPALLAVAQTRGLTGDRLLAGYAVGVQAMGRLGLALGGGHYEAGFHSTATLGVIGAAVACGWAIELSAPKLAVAIGLAVTQASGLRLQFGSAAKPLHAGLAARNGLTSALLAEAGLAGAIESLGGKGGFLDVYGFGQAAAEHLLARDDDWQILDPGLIFKRYASCAATHHAADAALALHAERGSDAPVIEAIEVTFPPGLITPLAKQLPTDRADGRFSVEYVIAHALLRGHLDAGAFERGAVDPDIAALMRRVSVRVDERVPSITRPPFSRFSIVELIEVSGARFARRADAPRSGVPREKLIAAVRSRQRGEALLEQIAGLHDAQSLQRLLNALSQPFTDY